ncbi:MAG: hypothetical protein HUU50_08525 [Candidatus Brocadiae bacterium]|nr:hypothetical protein [Candidatus Brocadiia bacterium]
MKAGILFVFFLVFFIVACKEKPKNQAIDAKKDWQSLIAEKTPNVWQREKGIQDFAKIEWKKAKSEPETKQPLPESQKEREAKELFQKLTQKISENQDAKEFRNKLIKEYPESRYAILGALEYASDMARKDSKDAIECYEQILQQWPNAPEKWQAIHSLQNLTNTYLYLYNYGTFHSLDSSNMQFYIQGNNIDEVKLTIYEVDLVKMLEEGIHPQSPSVPEHAKEVKSWMEKAQERRDSWFYKQIKLPKLDPGHYLLSASSKYFVLNSLFSTSRLALLSKNDDNIILCWGKDIVEKKTAGVSRVFLMKNSDIIHQGTTNSDGFFVASIANKENDSNQFTVIMDSPLGQAASSGYYSWYNSSRNIGYCYTERPVYRPGQKVYFKGIFYQEKPASNQTIRVTVHDSGYKTIYEKDHKTNEFGSIQGELTLSAKASLGSYQIQMGGSFYANSSFDVQEYKKPEYEVSVIPSQNHIVQGDTISILAKAIYYFGEPVKEADVEYKIYESPYWHNPYQRDPGDEWSWFRVSNIDDYELSPFHGKKHTRRYYHYQENQERLFHQGQSKLDDKGEVKISLTTNKKEGQDLRYRVEVSVIDKSRRSISSSASILATYTAFHLSIRPDRWYYRSGEKATITVRAQEYSGKSISVPITLSAMYRENSEYISLFTKDFQTNEQGIFSYEFYPDGNGSYLFSVEATDNAKRKIRADHSFWVSTPGWRSPIVYSGLEIQLEKTTCLPGEKIRGMITSGHESSYVLLTLENNRIQKYQLIQLDGSSFSLEESISDSCEPFVNVTATMLEQEGMVIKSVKVTVPPLRSFLKIGIARNKPQYTPGENATYTIKIADWKDNPVQAEFSFGLVDEAIYAIRTDNTPDIRQAFYGNSFGNVQTSSSFQFYSQGYGEKNKKSDKGIAEPSMAMEKSAKQEISREKEQADGDRLVEAKVRTEFADSGVWKPSVTTDKQGIAKVSFTMPDNLTAWRATLRAIDTKGLVGQTLDKVITRKNFMVRLQTPRTFTERDQVTISGVIHNYLSSPKDAVCRLKLEGAKLLDDFEKKIQLEPGQDKRVDWLIDVTSLEKVVLEISALTNEESDAMRLTIPVVPYGIQSRLSQSGVFSEKTEFSLDLPESCDLKRAKLTVRVKPTIAGSMLESLEYLAGYPYGCVEQTMSKFLPSVIVAQTLQKLNMRHAKLEEELPKYVAKGTERLYDFQHSDGGWGWWKQDNTNPYMTAYVIYGLSIARGADFSIDSGVIERGLKSLENLIPQEKALESQTYMIFAYSQAKKPQAEWVEKLYENREKMDNYCKGIFLLTLNQHKDKRAREILSLLEKNAIHDNDYAYFKGKANYGWTDSDIESTAYCLKAIVNIDPEHSLLPKLLRWMEIKKRGSSYASTKDTASVVFAMADYLQHSGELNPEYQGAVSLNGQEHSFSFSGQEGNVLQKEITLMPDSISNRVEIHKKGKGKVYFTAYIDYYTKDEKIPPASNGIKVQREYFKLVPEKQKEGNIVYVPYPLEDRIQEGELIEVVLTLKGAGNYSYVMLEDFKIAGCEFEKDQDKNRNYYYFWSNREERDDRLVVFFTYYSSEERKISYRLRAEIPGVYHAMPARAEMMYFPEVSGHSSEKKLTIMKR